MHPNINIKKITEYLEKPGGKITLGIHSCIEEIWEIIATRKTRDDYIVYTKMQDFAKDVLACGAGGYSNEITLKRRSYGGFVTNTGKAVSRLGGDLTLIGLFGTDTIDPVFEEFQEAHTLLSVGNPTGGATYEFSDGKIMFPYIDNIVDFNWTTMKNALPWDQIEKAFREAEIIGLGYWSLMPAFDEIIENISNHFLGNSKCKRLFFDFADLRKRDTDSLKYTLEKLAVINKKTPITLSLNEHEAEMLFSRFGEDFDGEQTVTETAMYNLREKTGLDEIVVHTPYFAAVSSYLEGIAIIPQRHCENPVRTTGAGDNFNGGYMVAGVFPGELNLSERLFVGNATTGFFVREGYPPDVSELVQEMNDMEAYFNGTID